jgi:hypothetical protein
MNRIPFGKYVYFTALLNIAILIFLPSITFPQTTTTITDPQPACVSVAPSFVGIGTTLDVTITGENTHFDSTSVVTFTCAGITVNSATANSETEITANITVAADSSTGLCNVTVTTGLEVITCSNLFAIPPCCGACRGVTPSTAKAGETLDVIITLNSIDLTGITISKDNVNFVCTGVTVNSATVNSATEIMANITVDCKAQACTDDVTITGSSDVGIVCSSAFTVESNPCTISVSPATVNTGFLFPRNKALTITGEGGCNFDSSTTVTISGGVIVQSVTVDSANQLTVTIQTPPVILGGKGEKTVTVQTGCTEATSAFIVRGLVF